MQLNNFGSIINFAVELETKDEAFYRSAVNNSDCSRFKAVFEQITSDCQKNQKNLQRIRRENVTEMILEGINDFDNGAYILEHGAPDNMKAAEVLNTAQQLEKKAEQFYLDAAEKVKALSEVARELKLLAKKRTAHLNNLIGL
jgi:rubrerythrin